MSSFLYSFSQQTGTAIYGVGALLFGVAYMMSDEYSPFKIVFAVAAIIFAFVAILYYFLSVQYKKDCVLSASGVCSASLCGLGYWSAVNVSTPQMFGGNCNTSTALQCHGPTLTCGVNACVLGVYNMSPWTSWTSNWKGSKNAKWIYSASNSAKSADSKNWSFYNASISACNVSYAVTIEAMADDMIDSIIWNGSVINPVTFKTDSNTVHIPNVSFIPSFNIIQVSCHNNTGSGGVIYSVNDSNNNDLMISSAASTMTSP